MTIELKDLRKLLKPLGFRAGTFKLSCGRVVLITHVESGSNCNGMPTRFCNDAERKLWMPVINILNQYECATDKGEKLLAFKH